MEVRPAKHALDQPAGSSADTKCSWLAGVQLFKKARKHGLKVQAVMSFHAGGGNVGDGSTDIPLPLWVIEVHAEAWADP